MNDIIRYAHSITYEGGEMIEATTHPHVDLADISTYVKSEDYDALVARFEALRKLVCNCKAFSGTVAETQALFDMVNPENKDGFFTGPINVVATDLDLPKLGDEFLTLSSLPDGTVIIQGDPSSIQNCTIDGQPRRPQHANPPADAAPCGTHPDNDGLDEFRGEK